MLRAFATHMAGRLRLVAMLFALAVAGGTGTAVALTAAASTPSHPAAVTVSDSESPDETEAPETPEPKESEAADDQGEDNGADPTEAPKPSSTPCPGGLSHGEFVSKVAQGAPTGQDAEHGKTVSEAAHQNCGKGGDDAAENENENENEQGDDNDAATEHHSPGKPSTAGTDKS